MGGACNLASSPQLLLQVSIICSITLISFGLAASASAKLHFQEVSVLREIGKKLGKKDWDFSKDPCSGEGNWSILDERKGFENSVTCDCSFNNNSSCHLVSIALKSQNLSGIIPPEFSKFRYLKQLDLSRNLFTGVIPPQWGALRLEEFSVMGNRLSGPFPKVLTNMTTLRNLSIEGNHFSGPIPPEIGRLINLQKLVFSSNALTGNLPAELGKLVNLTDMRINDNNFSGKLPTFISKWTKVQKLHIQGTSLKGPIPSSIASLTKLSDLRISDLTGRGSPFPPLSDMESMKTLILRNCLIYGEIPEYVGQMEKLKHLDVSFNNLRGEIPSTFIQLARIDFLYLTGNKLSGSVPPWLLERNKNVDLSYNNFTWQSSNPDECSRGSVNIVESFSPSTIKSSKAHSCLKQNFPCSASRNQQHYSLHINCGGNEITVDGNTTYQDDKEPRGASMFYSHPSQEWAFSSTGNFMDDDSEADAYTKTNKSAISNVSATIAQLYTTARVSPLSLTYYGLCLMNGNYTVKLHFAEIIFTNDSSLTSLGKRIFDVYIQGNLVLKDFNIEDEAGGVAIPLVKTFIAAVTHHTLKIRLYWAGRGTTGIPLRGIYGPLISAISVDPNFKPPSNGSKRNVVIIVTGAVAGAIFLAFLVLGVMWRNGCLCGKAAADKDDDTHISTRIAGTMPKEEFVYLLDWAYVLQERGSLLELVDPELGSEYSSEEAMVMLNVALLCTNASPTLRPTMSQVVSMLEGRTPVQDLLSDPGFSAINTKYKAIRNHFWQNPSQTYSMSINESYRTDSTSSGVEPEDAGRLLRVSSFPRASEHNESKPKTDQGSLPANPIGEVPKDGACKVDRALSLLWVIG
uniref:non-specific serine/threonine protein kinase n=1 Tax=Populus alba TaxID=43335 RepID=A0A4U5QL12_POPAL|nr:putative LRR receptor-like serine/threonine-protein kinase [Populus alba]